MKHLTIILTFGSTLFSENVIKLFLGSLNKTKVWCLLSMGQKEETVNNWGNEAIQWSQARKPHNAADLGAGEMSHWFRALADLVENLDQIPSPYLAAYNHL